MCNLLFETFFHRTFAECWVSVIMICTQLQAHNILRMQAKKNAATYYQCWVGARVFDFINNFWFQFFVSGISKSENRQFWVFKKLEIKETSVVFSYFQNLKEPSCFMK